MSFLYCTADRVPAAPGGHGGSTVVWHEAAALSSLGPCAVWDRERLTYPPQYYTAEDNQEPWKWDNWAYYNSPHVAPSGTRLAHFYAGTFSRTVAELKRRGVKVVYTAAAHDVAKSKAEHDKLGLAFPYPHLTDPALWARYLRGYRDADVLVVPSTHSRDAMRGFGCTNRIEVIPHGVDPVPPEKLRPPPEKFVVGYLGAVSPDKGVRYLLEAWEKLSYPDAVLRLGGRDSNGAFCRSLVRHFCPTAKVECVGWLDNVADFYNSISLYVQPSVTEGFGIEVLEAAAHGRPVLCSTGAGAADCVLEGWRFPAGDAADLAKQIDSVRVTLPGLSHPDIFARGWRVAAADYTWDKIRLRYQDLWRTLLA